MNVLIVDDEPLVRRALQRMFVARGHGATAAASGGEALERSEPDVEAFVIDWVMPDQSGLEVTRELRARGDARPVVLISGHFPLAELATAFEAGADDFMQKPCGAELVDLVEWRVARWRGRGHAPASASSPVVRAGRRGAWVVGPLGEQRVDLTPTETDILSVLHDRLGSAVSRDEILAEVWGPRVNVTSRAVHSHMHRLRQKIGAAGLTIVSVRGVGYALHAPDRLGDDVGKLGGG